jgi:hypothetical protein
MKKAAWRESGRMPRIISTTLQMKSAKPVRSSEGLPLLVRLPARCRSLLVQFNYSLRQINFNAGVKYCLNIDVRFHTLSITRRYSNIPRSEQNDQREMPQKNRHGDFSKETASAFTPRRRRRLAIACQKLVCGDHLYRRPFAFTNAYTVYNLHTSYMSKRALPSAIPRRDRMPMQAQFLRSPQVSKALTQVASRRPGSRLSQVSSGGRLRLPHSGSDFDACTKFSWPCPASSVAYRHR